MTRLLLTLLYPLLLMRRVSNALQGRDPLRLSKPGGSSCWIERDRSTSSEDYFSESATAGAMSRSLAVRALTTVAAWFAPSRLQPGEKFSAAADRDQGIPDEVYTLW